MLFYVYFSDEKRQSRKLIPGSVPTLFEHRPQQPKRKNVKERIQQQQVIFPNFS